MDHGAWAKAAVIYVGEVVSESSTEEVRESSSNVFVETVGGSKSARASGEKENGVLREEDICGRQARSYVMLSGDESCG